MTCVHCGLALGDDIGHGLYTHANHRQRCQSEAVPYGHMGHPTMPCPNDSGDLNPCSGAREEHCEHIHAPVASESDQ